MTEDESATNGESALRRARRHKGLTQDGLAEKAGCGQATISEIERGEYRVSLALARRIAAVLDVDVDDLFPANQRDEQVA